MKKIIAAILVLLSFPSFAAPKYLYTEESRQGETMDSFVVRVAKKAATRTKLQFNTEICGEIEEKENNYSLDFYTTVSDYSCDYIKVSGRRYTGQTVHTHPRGPGYSTSGFSEHDYNFFGYLILNPVYVVHQAGKGTERIVKENSRQQAWQPIGR